jgi:hypothetical protein
MRTRTAWLLGVFLTALAAGDEGVERPEPSRGTPRRTPGGFGPAADGKEGSHDLLEKQGWVYLADGRIPKAGDWNPLGLWHVCGARSPDRSPWTTLEDGGERILHCAREEGSGPADLASNQSFWDFDLHVELRVGEGASGGILLRGRYEIEIAATGEGRAAADLTPGDLGGIAGFRAPSEGAGKGAGKWQVIDASIRGFRLTVRVNGEVVQDDVEIPEALRRGTSSAEAAEDAVKSPGPVVLRVEQGAIDVRNIRVRPRPAPAIWRARGPED